VLLNFVENYIKQTRYGIQDNVIINRNETANGEGRISSVTYVHRYFIYCFVYQKVLSRTVIQAILEIESLIHSRPGQSIYSVLNRAFKIRHVLRYGRFFLNLRKFPTFLMKCRSGFDDYR
jgi:hypothetical protein